jgi:ATP-dependent Lhr-like helicase
LFQPLPPSDEALVEIVRGRLEGLGPVPASGIAESLALPASRINIALAALEAEGFAMRGRFGPSAAQDAAGSAEAGIAEEEWC